MKKLLYFILTATLVFALSVPVFADLKTAEVYVSVSPDGTLQLAYEPVTVTDLDCDGTLSINDALIAAHEKYYDGGVSGYISEKTDYGMSLYKLWGIENGGSYGYCVNDISAMSLLDPICDGDRIYAYGYTDLSSFSDVYAYFDTSFGEVSCGIDFTLTLLSSGYDANWMPITSPVSGAVITVDGEVTEFVTDENGTVTLSLPEGIHTVSALSDSVTITPPAAVITSVPSAPETGDGAFYLAAVAVISLFSIVTLKKKHEK